MSDRSSDRIVHVCQGECYVSNDSNEVLSTVLGSCVSVCLWDPTAQVGGMNHFLLPTDVIGQSSQPERYGVHAMELLVNALLKSGARHGQMQAKLFGGARISTNLRDIGISNINFAREFLENENIVCIAESTGGAHARRLHFRAATGRASLMLVPKSDILEPPVVQASDLVRSCQDNITMF